MDYWIGGLIRWRRINGLLQAAISKLPLYEVAVRGALRRTRPTLDLVPKSPGKAG